MNDSNELASLRRDVRDGSKVADDIALALEHRVTAIEEVLAARWPRRWWCAARLGRAIRRSVRDFPGAIFTERRFDATSTEGTADMIRRAQDGER